MSCKFDGCKRKIAPVMGDCKYCVSSFCSTHRLPEDHQCIGLEKCRQTRFELNKTKLMKEKFTEQKIR